ncbi:uncharacterized protein [Cherax quadricarinatus]|uniref:uncharacterized protein n=1 Tax=Cherax quadricarinatus TaxID=27406 RepID=UPI00387EAEE1
MFLNNSHISVIMVLIMTALSPLTTQGCQESPPWQTNITLPLTPKEGVWAASVGVRPDNNIWTLSITVYTNKKSIIKLIITSTNDTLQKLSWTTDTETEELQSRWPPHTHFLPGQTSKLLVMVSSTVLTLQLCTSSTCKNITLPLRHRSVISEANLNVFKLSGGENFNICRYPAEGCQESPPWQTNITLPLTPKEGVWAASVGVRPDNNIWTLSITVYTNKKSIINLIITSTDTWQKLSWTTDTETEELQSPWPPHTHFLPGQTSKLLVMVSSTELTLQLCTSSTCKNNTWPLRHRSVINEANLNVFKLSGGENFNICHYPAEGEGTQTPVTNSSDSLQDTDSDNNEGNNNVVWMFCGVAGAIAMVLLGLKFVIKEIIIKTHRQQENLQCSASNIMHTPAPTSPEASPSTPGLGTESQVLHLGSLGIRTILSESPCAPRCCVLNDRLLLQYKAVRFLPEFDGAGESNDVNISSGNLSTTVRCGNFEYRTLPRKTGVQPSATKVQIRSSLDDHVYESVTDYEVSPGSHTSNNSIYDSYDSFCQQT